MSIFQFSCRFFKVLHIRKATRFQRGRVLSRLLCECWIYGFLESIS